MRDLDDKLLYKALSLLGEYLNRWETEPYRLVICGGAALIARSLVYRTTQDVDIVALLGEGDKLISPDPLPEELVAAAKIVKNTLELKDNWLNNEPSREPGGIFQLGFPEGLAARLTQMDFGPKLTAYFLDRYDQIHLKLFASVDSGPGGHVKDLLKLNPKEEELEAAATWAISHDSSPGFRMMLISMLKQLGFRNVAERIQ